jgi:hypothetical protein
MGNALMESATAAWRGRILAGAAGHGPQPPRKVRQSRDESKEGGFRLAAVAVEPGELAELRSLVQGFRMRGQRRLHFTGERDGRRKQIIKALLAVPIQAVIYDAPAHPTVRSARAAVIGQLAEDVAAVGAERLVLETDDSTVGSDKHIIRERLAKASCDSLRYEHQRAYEECLLSVPDAVIWCWAKGGHWRAAITPAIEQVVIV